MSPLPRSACGMASILHRFQISSPCAAIPQLPGAAGVGASGAATLLRRYGSLEAALAAGRRTGGKRLFKSIAATTPLPSLRKQKPTWSKAAALARKWELTQLAKRIEELATAFKQPDVLSVAATLACTGGQLARKGYFHQCFELATRRSGLPPMRGFVPHPHGQ